MSRFRSMHVLIKCVIFKANRVVTNLLDRKIISSIFSSTTNKSYGYKSVLFKCYLISSRSHTSFLWMISKHI